MLFSDTRVGGSKEVMFCKYAQMRLFAKSAVCECGQQQTQTTNHIVVNKI